MTRKTNQKEAIRLLKIVKKEFQELYIKGWHGNAITVGQCNKARNILEYTFDNIENLIKKPS